MAVTLINAFIVPEGKQEEFLEHWNRTSRYFSTHPGFIETHLHRNAGVGNGTFSFINIARWESAEVWRSTHDEYKPTEYNIPGVKGHAAIFESIVDLYSSDPKHSQDEDSPLRVGFFRRETVNG